MFTFVDITFVRVFFLIAGGLVMLVIVAGIGVAVFRIIEGRMARAKARLKSSNKAVRGKNC